MFAFICLWLLCHRQNTLQTDVSLIPLTNRSCCYHCQKWSPRFENCILVIRTCLKKKKLYAFKVFQILLFFFPPWTNIRTKPAVSASRYPVSTQYSSNQNRMPSTLQGLFFLSGLKAEQESSVCSFFSTLFGFACRFAPFLGTWQATLYMWENNSRLVRRQRLVPA